MNSRKDCVTTTGTSNHNRVNRYQPYNGEVSSPEDSVSVLPGLDGKKSRAGRGFSEAGGRLLGGLAGGQFVTAFPGHFDFGW